MKNNKKKNTNNEAQKKSTSPQIRLDYIRIEKIDRQINRQIDGWRDRQIDRSIDRSINIQLDRQRDRYPHTPIVNNRSQYQLAMKIQNRYLSYDYKL